ncbi:MAG: hypothetical protein LKK00_01740 [Intestinimonas sp.]|nr:hypothetical protein [Intestinimonas sp.]
MAGYQAEKAALLLFAAAFCGDKPSTALVLLITGATVQILSGRRITG